MRKRILIMELVKCCQIWEDKKFDGPNMPSSRSYELVRYYFPYLNEDRDLDKREGDAWRFWWWIEDLGFEIEDDELVFKIEHLH